MQDPDLAILGDHAARVFHLRKHVHAVGLAVAVLIDAADDPAAPGRAAERPLLVHRDVNRAVRSDRQGHRVADLRRGREQADLEPGRGLDDLADRLVVDRPERSVPARRSEVELGAIAVLLSRELIRDRGGPLLGERPQVGCRRRSRRAETHGRLRPLGPRRLFPLDDRLGRTFDRRDIGQESILAEDGRREFLDDLLMGLSHLLDREQPVGQPVLPAVGSGDAHVHELIGRPHHREVRERQLLVARNEDEPVGLRVQEQGIVVRRA